MANNDKDADFFDYVDSVKRKEMREQRKAEAQRLRQEWWETTWAGSLINIVEKLHIASFFTAIGNSFEKGEDSTSFYITSLVYKIGIISASIIAVYLIGWFTRLLTGDEIILDEEVVIVEKVTKSQVEAEERAKAKKNKSKSQ